jgi:glycosyltransferase involved in cell wall biosynthesis
VASPHLFIPEANHEQHQRYSRLIDGEHARGERESIVFCVYTTDLEAGRGDVYVAGGLGLELVALGYGVSLVPRERWHLLPPADVVVAMLPTFDPSAAPAGAWRVAWVRNETERWAALDALQGFDQVISSSHLTQRRLRRETDRAEGVLRIGVDTELFGPHPGRAPDSFTRAVTTANHWGTVRDVHRAIADMPRATPLTMYGNVTAHAPARLRHRAKEPVSYFALPALYRHHGLVVDDTIRANIGFGNVNSRFFESAACGALPVLNSRLGLADLGLLGTQPDVPVYSSADDLVDILTTLLAEPAELERRAEALGEWVREKHSYAVRAHEFSALVLDREERPVNPARAVHFGPDYSAENPYQTLLYSGLGQRGIYTVPVSTGGLTRHLAQRAEGTAPPGVFHLHWTGPVLQRAASPIDALTRLEDFTNAVRKFKEQGGRLVWTIHNVLPHDARFRPLEVNLAQFLAKEAHLVHVLSMATLEAVAPHYELDPATTRVVEHSSYEGVYPDFVTRETARKRLRILPSEKVLIALGGIRPYKGFARLLDVLDRMTHDDPTLRLLVAGKPGRYPQTEELRRRCDANPRVLAHFDFVPADHLQLWFGAADLAVLPYVDILNSGAFWLAQTFGLPVVAPRAGALARMHEEPHVRLFDPSTTSDLEATLRDAVRAFVTPDQTAHLRRRAKELAHAHAPRQMGEHFAREVAPLVLDAYS